MGGVAFGVAHSTTSRLVLTPPLFFVMGNFINQFKVNGTCCECECEKREGPCDCCDCCPDEVLPVEVCVYCVKTETKSNASGCCTQSYRYSGDVRKLTLQAGSCDYVTDGVKVLEYDSAAGFWTGTFCTAAVLRPAVGGCEHISGKYYDANGNWSGGVVTDGYLPAEQWLQDCSCVAGSPPCECIPDDNPYTYETEEDCTETSTDPCCEESNRVCPQDEGVAFVPANGVCP